MLAVFQENQCGHSNEKKTFGLGSQVQMIEQRYLSKCKAKLQLYFNTSKETKYESVSLHICSVVEKSFLQSSVEVLHLKSRL
jgi:hypothetical protein